MSVSCGMARPWVKSLMVDVVREVTMHKLIHFRFGAKVSQVLGLSLLLLLSHKNLKIFEKSENLPKIWKSSKNLKIFQKSENLPKI